MPKGDTSTFASLKESASSFDSALSDLLFSTPGNKIKNSMKSLYNVATKQAYADISSDDMDTDDDDGFEVVGGGIITGKKSDDNSDDSNPMSMNSSCEEDDDDLSDDDDESDDDDTNAESEGSYVPSSDEEVISEESSDETPCKKKKVKPSAPPLKKSPAVAAPVSKLAQKLKENPKPVRGKGRPPREKLGPFDPESFTPKPFRRDSGKDKDFFSTQNTIKFQDVNRALSALDNDVLLDDVEGKRKFIVPAFTGFLRTVLVIDNTSKHFYAMSLSPGVPPRLDHDNASIKWTSPVPPLNINKRESCEAIDGAIGVLSTMYDCPNIADSLNPCTVLASELQDGKQGPALYGFVLAVVDNKKSCLHFYPYPKMSSSVTKNKARISNREPKGVKFRHLVIEAFRCGNRNPRTTQVLKFPGHAPLDAQTAVISDSDFKTEIKSALLRLKKEVDKRMSGPRSKNIPPHELIQGQFQALSTGVHSGPIVPDFVSEMYSEMYAYWFGFHSGKTYVVSLSAAQSNNNLSRVAPAGCSLNAITNDSAHITIVDTGSRSKWPPLARVSFSAFKAAGGGTEITEADIPAESLRNLIHLKGAKEVPNALPTFPEPEISKKSPASKSKSKLKPKPKSNPKPKSKATPSPKPSPKSAQKSNGKSRPKPNLSRMKTYRGIIVPETLLNAEREEMIDRLSNCDKLFTPPRGVSRQRIPVKDMDHTLATTEELRARCADIFYGPAKTASPVQDAEKGASPHVKNRQNLKRKLEFSETQTNPKKNAKVSGTSSESQSIQDWFLANTGPSAPRQFILNRKYPESSGKQDVHWLVNVTVKDMSDATRL